ncbi:PLAC8 family protein [Phytophthora cinnamomi]|uniref:PLAC8 family protein n=1 Tax=Phytophthora cinnamomi TaxID=4785 RepID=UPI0035597E62|nr:PLAC8 family protein [Phytophthora cinnamomi]
MTTPGSASKYAAVVTSSADALQERKIQDAQPSLDPVQANGGNWDVAFFGCFSSLVPNCFMSTICPCVAIAQIQARLGNCYVKALYGHGSAMFGLLVCCVLFTTHSIDNQDNQLPSAALHTRHSSGGQQVLFLCGAAFFYLVYAANVCHLRARVRKEFQIDGNCGNDCVVAICCPPCAIAQMASQTQSYTPAIWSSTLQPPRTDRTAGDWQRIWEFAASKLFHPTN